MRPMTKKRGDHQKRHAATHSLFSMLGHWIQKIIIKSMQRASTAAKRSNAWKWKIANTTKTSWATSEAKRFAIRTTWPLTPLYNKKITIQKLFDANTNTQTKNHKPATARMPAHWSWPLLTWSCYLDIYKSLSTVLEPFIQVEIQMKIVLKSLSSRNEILCSLSWIDFFAIQLLEISQWS